MANVFIDIAAEFTGRKAFKKAETETEKLTKQVKQLAKTFGLAFGTAQVVAYGKASIKAAAADQKAQQQLALALKNVGLERDAASAEGFIQRIQREYGIIDDLLRPAYQSLAIATRDTAESQRLLNLSLDISAATGKDLSSVTAALSKAYLGNNTALTRLGVGISKADLKTKSFYEITTSLADTFKGSATAAANTFQGSIDKLAVASANVKEIIGTGLIDALTNLGENDSVADLASSMESAAEYTADVIRGIGVLTEKLKALPGVSNFKLGMIPVVGSYLEGLRGLGQASQIKPKPFSTPMTISGQGSSSKSVASQQTKIAKDTLKAQKDSLKLAKARAVFDLQKIQIEAALKGKISKEDEIRLKLMKAIEDENLSGVEKYQKALETAQTKTKELTTLLETVKTLEIKDPFGTWSVDPLTAAINALTDSIGGIGTKIRANGSEWSSFANLVATTVIRPNLTEWSSSFSKASSDAAAATAAAITATNKANSDALAAQQAAAAAALKKLNEENAASSAAATKAAQDAINALNKTTSEQIAALKAAAAAAAAAAASGTKTVDTTTLTGILAASGTSSSTTTSTINVTVSGDPFTDPNAVAEKVVEIIRNAGQRGTIDALGFE